MQLKKSTPAGTLIASYKQDEKTPGFYIDLYRKEMPKDAMGRYQGVCEVFYHPELNKLVIHTYKKGGELHSLNEDLQELVIDLYSEEELEQMNGKKPWVNQVVK